MNFQSSINNSTQVAIELNEFSQPDIEHNEVTPATLTQVIEHNSQSCCGFFCGRTATHGASILPYINAITILAGVIGVTTSAGGTLCYIAATQDTHLCRVPAEWIDFTEAQFGGTIAGIGLGCLSICVAYFSCKDCR